MKLKVIICPIATAHSMGQITKPFASVRVSVCAHSHARISWWIFTKIGTDIRTPKSKNEFVGGKHRIIPSPFAPKPPILGEEVLKKH